MSNSSPHSLRAASVKHHDRGLTLVFGSDGQVSLIGFNGGAVSQPVGVPPVFTAGNTGSLTPGTRSLSSETASALPVPNLEATSASSTSTSFFTTTTTSTPTASSLASFGSTLSPTATSDADTDIPSIPTVNYPTPSPTAVSNPTDHGVGAPFYLAIVLASISFIGCVAAFIAWWVRSRARRRNLELEDPWNNRDSASNTSHPSIDDANDFEKGAHLDVEAQARPYYLPASIVRRSSSNLLSVPHTIPALEDGAVQRGVSRPSLGRVNGPYSQNLSYQSSSYQNVSSSQTASLRSRPDTTRLQTGLSVQESTCTLGRLRVANRVPGDITSGDEGGMNMPRLQNGVSSSFATDTGELHPEPVGAGENATQDTRLAQGDRTIPEGDILLEPPGPATLPWGRRMDTIAALRRSRRRTPEMTAETYKNASYGGYWYPTLNGRPNRPIREEPTAANQEEHDNALAKPLLDPLGWKSTLKSSFWQAVDSMTGNRLSVPETHADNASGSRFTPAPQRVASRRSPVSPVTPKYELTLPEHSIPTQDTLHEHSRSDSSSTRTDRSDASQASGSTIRRIDSTAPRVSHLNYARNHYTNTPRRHPDYSFRTDTGSMYSTDSAAARANLRKYGYGDPIPSSWSSLGERRDSELDLDRMHLPLPRPIRSYGPRPLSTTPSRLTSELSLRSGSVSTHTPTRFRSNAVGLDDSGTRSGKNLDTASHGETTMSSTYSLSRNGTIQSGRSTMGPGVVASQASSTTSSMLSRKKGVTRRKRPRPPPRAPSTASSVQSIESGLSLRDMAVRRALLERRKKVKAAEGMGGRESDSQSQTMRSCDGNASSLV